MSHSETNSDHNSVRLVYGMSDILYEIDSANIKRYLSPIVNAVGLVW
jgi:hypothetical protein